MKEFSKHPEFGYMAVAFLIACMIWASPSLFLRNSGLGKLLLVAGIIAMTMYHRIAGIVALILVIAMLNRNPIKEGLTLGNPMTSSTSTPPPISFKTPDEFRQKYCLKGLPDDPTQSEKLEFTYMLSPTFFTLDASGNPTMNEATIKAFGSFDPNSFNKCTPMTVKNGGVGYETIHNICDPACNWTIKPDSTTPSGDPSVPTTAPAIPTIPTIPTIPSLSLSRTTEGFNPMSALRPRIRSGRHFITDGVDHVKSVANRLKRQFF